MPATVRYKHRSPPDHVHLEGRGPSRLTTLKSVYLLQTRTSSYALDIVTWMTHRLLSFSPKHCPVLGPLQPHLSMLFSFFPWVARNLGCILVLSRFPFSLIVHQQRAPVLELHLFSPLAAIALSCSCGVITASRCTEKTFCTATTPSFLSIQPLGCVLPGVCHPLRSFCLSLGVCYLRQAGTVCLSLSVYPQQSAWCLTHIIERVQEKLRAPLTAS